MYLNSTLLSHTRRNRNTKLKYYNHLFRYRYTKTFKQIIIKNVFRKTRESIDIFSGARLFKQLVLMTISAYK